MLALAQLLQRVQSKYRVLVPLPKLLLSNDEGSLEDRPCLAVVSLHDDAWQARGRASGMAIRTHLDILQRFDMFHAVTTL